MIRIGANRHVDIPQGVRPVVQAPAPTSNPALDVIEPHASGVPFALPHDVLGFLSAVKDAGHQSSLRTLAEAVVCDEPSAKQLMALPNHAWLAKKLKGYCTSVAASTGLTVPEAFATIVAPAINQHDDGFRSLEDLLDVTPLNAGQVQRMVARGHRVFSAYTDAVGNNKRSAVATEAAIIFEHGFAEPDRNEKLTIGLRLLPDIGRWKWKGSLATFAHAIVGSDLRSLRLMSRMGHFFSDDASRFMPLLEQVKACPPKALAQLEKLVEKSAFRNNDRETLAKAFDLLDQRGLAFRPAPLSGAATAFERELGHRKVLRGVNRFTSGADQRRQDKAGVEYGRSEVIVKADRLAEGVIECSFELNTRVPNRISKLVFLGDALSFIAQKQLGEVRSIVVELDAADRNAFADTRRLNALPSVRALAELGFRPEGTVTDPKGKQQLTFVRGKSTTPVVDAPARVYSYLPRHIEAHVEDAARAIIKRGTKPADRVSTSIDEYAKRNDIALPADLAPELRADLEAAFNQLNDLSAMHKYFKGLIGDAALLALASPTHADIVVTTKHVPRWAYMGALMKRSNHIGVEPGSTPARHMTRKNFQKFMRKHLLAIDRLFLNYNKLGSIPHSSVLHWVQLTAALEVVKDPKGLMEFLGSDEGGLFWMKLFDSFTAEGVRCNYRVIAEYLRDVLHLP